MGPCLLTDIKHQNKPLGLLLEKKETRFTFLRFKFLETARFQKSPSQKLKTFHENNAQLAKVPRV